MNEEVRTKALRRLKIIRGQVEGLERMIEQDTYCVNVLTQVSAIHEALRGVGKLVVRNHLETCVTQSIQQGNAHPHYDELMSIIYKLAK